jgi:hypothetical protein
VKVVHDLFDRRLVIPYVNIENIEVRCAKLLQASVETEAHRLDAVAMIVNFLFDARVRQLVVEAILILSVNI